MRESRGQEIGRGAVARQHPQLFKCLILQIQIFGSAGQVRHSTDGCVEPEVPRIGKREGGIGGRECDRGVMRQTEERKMFRIQCTYSVGIILRGSQGAEEEKVYWLLTASCSNHNSSLSYITHSPISIVNPFSR